MRIFSSTRRLFAIGLLFATAHWASAQTVASSNLGNSTSATGDITNVRRMAGSFTTGAGSLSLNSVTLNFGERGNVTGGLRVDLFSGDLTAPSTQLIQLSGSTNPGDFTDSTFTAVGNYNLVASTTYWIVASINPGSTGVFRWSETYSGAQTGWDIGNNSSTSTDGSTWSQVQFVAMKFSVTTGSAIPEPSTYAMLGGIAALAFVIRKLRQS